MAKFGINSSDESSSSSSESEHGSSHSDSRRRNRRNHYSQQQDDDDDDQEDYSWDDDDHDDDDDMMDDAPPSKSLAVQEQENNSDDDDDDDEERPIHNNNSRNRRHHQFDRDDSYDTVRVSSAAASTSRSSSASSPPPPPPPHPVSQRPGHAWQSSNSQPWAAKLHLEPKRVAVMQASFFQQSASTPAPVQQPTSDPLNDRESKRSKLQSSHTHNNSSNSTQQSSRRPAAPAPVPAPPVDPAPFRSYRHYDRTDLDKSVIRGQEGNLIDMGLALGRSFRVTWGPNGEIVRLSKRTTRSDTLQIDKFKSEPSFDKETALRDLKLQLSHTPIYPATSSSPTPVAVPGSGLRFHHFVASLSTADASPEASLWRLGHALFDEIQDLELPSAEQADPTQRRYIEDVRRRDLLEQWLADVVRSEVEEELRSVAAAETTSAADADASATAGARRVFALLSGHQIERACDAALEAGDLRLATLVAQAGGDDAFREDVYLQLAKWREYRVDAHIAPAVRRVYELLCGNLGQSDGRNTGDRADDVPELHVSEGLSWRRAFGLHLWYGTWRSPLSTAVARYESAFTSEPEKVAQPLPDYLSPRATKDRPTTTQQWRNLDSEPSSAPTDPLFQLIKLYTSPTHSLEQALLPRNFGSSPIDYRLPWHLFILFSRVLRLRDFEDRLEVDDREDAGMVANDDGDGDGDGSSPAVQGNSVTADRVTESFASQLELNGLWEWAVFVLLHLELSDSREKALREIISRHASAISPDQFTFLVDVLKIPATWIYAAQAIAVRSNSTTTTTATNDGTGTGRGTVFAEYKLWLAAERWSTAHELAVRELAPEAVLRNDPALLRRLFAPIDRDQVADWNQGAQVFLDYVACLEQQASRYRRGRDDGNDDLDDDDDGRDRGEPTSEAHRRAHLARTLDAVHALSTATTTTTTTTRTTSTTTKLKVALSEMHSRLTVLVHHDRRLLLLADDADDTDAPGSSSASLLLRRLQPAKMQESDRLQWVQGVNSSFLDRAMREALAVATA